MLTRDAMVEVSQALGRDGVRFLFVGGLAVIAHGYLRATTDLDIVLDLEVGNTRRALSCLAGLGFAPRLPIPIDDFADPIKRADWAEHRGMIVFSLWRDSQIGPMVVDLFVMEPFSFDDAWHDAVWLEYAGGIRFPCVDLIRLLDMKRAAGRLQDRLDVSELSRIHGLPP